MDYKSYRQKYFISQRPELKLPLIAMQGASICVQPYSEALAFYSKIFGSPHYIEGSSVHGWELGAGWFTIFPAEDGNPKNIDLPVFLKSRDTVDQLLNSFIASGSKDDPPSEQLMYSPVYVAFLTDPYDLNWSLIYSLSDN